MCILTSDDARLGILPRSRGTSTMSAPLNRPVTPPVGVTRQWRSPVLAERLPSLARTRPAAARRAPAATSCVWRSPASMGRCDGVLVSALFAAECAIFSARQSSTGWHERAASRAFDQLVDATGACFRPLFAAPSGLRRKTAETVGARRPFIQSTTDGGKNPPGDEQEDDDDEDSLHQPSSAGGDEYTPTWKFLILNYGFSEPLPKTAAHRLSGCSDSVFQLLLAWRFTGLHSKFKIQNSKFYEPPRTSLSIALRSGIAGFCFLSSFSFANDSAARSCSWRSN